ncbi:MAG: substrate-binding domain-containing protein [Pseudomonadota bacterium]|nr:substrate-binding domain-containing protein [Pseudomonadota bacterium]MDP1903200.1 substrate-binding domain-containing protein [Pseudomonadota bacterium]MDP2354425.1 substrate-binding domain-containing protein [Pseudomonadota bacterium]
MKTLKFLLLALSLALTGCGESPPPAKQAEAPPAQAPVKKQRIALVMKTLTNPFFVEMEKGARKAEAELGIELIVKTAAQETSFEQQVSIVNDLIQNQLVDALVLAPANAYHLIPTVKKAKDAGIPVVNIDARLDRKVLAESGLQGLPFISVDNEQGGYLSAKTLIEGVKKPTQAAILEGIRDAENAEARKRGALRAFAENPAIKVVASVTANWKIDEGYAVTKAMFAKHPNIGLIFAANDMMALGAIKYLEESGKKQVKVVGFDALTEARGAIDKGAMLASIDQQAAEQGYQGVLYALRLLKGEQLPAETLLNVKLVKAVSAP